MWNWLKRIGQFINSVTRRVLSRPAQRELSELDLDANQDRVADLAHALAEDSITVGEWELAMREEIKTAYIEQYLLGRGGVEQMTQADWGSIGGSLSESYSYLSNFSRQIANGELAEGQIRRRSQMYINSAREARERALRRVALETGMTEVRWVIDPPAEHCPDCVALEALSWKPIEPWPFGHSIPGSGVDTQCLTACRCHLEYR